MDDLKLKKLNDYMNETLKYLEETDYFFLENLPLLSRINDKFNEFLNEYDLTYKAKENKLTYNDVYLLAREIISKICPKYLPLYDKLLDSGELDFAYNNEYGDSYFEHGNNINLININRVFNYNDVVFLIHEFIHYTNGCKKNTVNRYVLTEFLSIYFELTTISYLVDSGVNKDEIGYCDRLKTTYNSSNTMYSYELPLASFYKFGCIDYDMIVSYINGISEEGFNYEVTNLLSRFEKIDNSDLDYKQKIDKYIEIFSVNYKYIFGTLLAFYAFKYCNIDDIIYLNDHINDEIYTDNDIFKILESVGFNFDDNFLEKCLESIKDYIKTFDISLKGSVK